MTSYDFTDLPTPNVPLLRKAVEWAEAEASKPMDQREWNQTSWAQKTSCGTAYCIAGYTVACQPGFQGVCEDGGPSISGAVVDGQWVNIESEATRLLGLTRDESTKLFYGDNDIEDVRRYAEEIAARAGDRL